MLCDAPHPIDKNIPEATYHFGVTSPTTVFDITYFIDDEVHLCAEHASILYKMSREELKKSLM